MGKILGIDTGTNSLGWAIVEKIGDEDYKLLEHGTNIFQEGVKIEKVLNRQRPRNVQNIAVYAYIIGAEKCVKFVY